MRLLRVAVGLACFLLVSLIAFTPTRDWLSDVAVDRERPVETDLTKAVYLVEAGTPPDNRLVAHDPSSATTAPVFVMPELGAVVSMALSPDRERLALSYTADYNVPGTGIYILDLAARDGEIVDDDYFEQITDESSSVVFDDLEFGPDGTTVWATVERGSGPSVVEVDLATGEISRSIDNAVHPAAGDGWVAYLTIEPDYSRRSVGRLDLDTGATSTIAVLDGQFDLDHLVADPDRERLLLAALIPPSVSSIEIGEPARAHGPHDDPVQWLTLDLGTGEVRRLAEHEPMSIRDAALLTTGELAVTTADGLVIVGGSTRTLVPSSVFVDLAG